MTEVAQFGIFKTVFYYTAFILLAPISTFFTVKILFESLVNTTDVTKNVWSAVAAIIVLHVALGLYIHKAYSNGEKVKEKEAKTD